ncbi:Zinc finger and SCAN domain-containing protein 5B [Tupaia chinensis]|uniref:Zinc finger and SCAN domain-containing protein 5B n=1 Tax=Tupaia chinensis TaxID=246437 RepID=L9KNG8_TUPCH|nr:Zinc finger and SCAN domain-containing protein 5B [Tupaia chinensis]
MATDLTFSLRCKEPCDIPEVGPSPSMSVQGTYLGVRDSNAKDWHQLFRAYSCSEEVDPIKNLQNMVELCYLWLRPDLHTKEQILDKLVMEQVMISMPLALQVLVMETGVETCKDLEEMLRNKPKEKPESWSIVTLEGQEFLVRNSGVQMSEAKASDMDDVIDLTTKCRSSVSEVKPAKRQDGQALQKLPGTDELSRGQEEALLGNIPAEGEAEGLGPQQHLENELRKDRKEMTGWKGQQPQHPEGPDSVRAEDGKKPQEETSLQNVNGNPLSSYALKREISTQKANRGDVQSLRRSKRRKSDSTCIAQGASQGATDWDTRECPGHMELNSVNLPSTEEPAGHFIDHKIPRLTLYTCQVCAKAFHFKSELIIHQRTHTGETPFKCKSRGKGFLQPSDLRAHQQIHTGEKPYTCSICHKQFTHESTLHNHKRIHTQEKPHECKDCKKRFKHKQNLSSHLRIHTGPKAWN